MRVLTFSVFLIFLFAVPFDCPAQTQLVIAWQAPVGSGYGYNGTTCGGIGGPPCLNCPPGSTEFQCFLSNVLPNISGIGFTIPWGEIDNCSPSSPCASDDQNCYATSNCYNWAWIDNALMDFVNANIGPSGSTKWGNGCAGGRPCKVVLILWLTTEEGNTNLFNNVPNTPAYVFTNAYASSPAVSSAPQDVVVCYGWQGTNAGGGAGWGGAAPITDSCWASGAQDYGLWNALSGAVILQNSNPECMQTHSLTSNYSGYPVMYEKPILTAAKAFLHALSVHYSSACPNNYSTSCGYGPTIASSIAYMRIGPSSGGQNYPFCACASSTGGNQCDGPGTTHNYWPGPQGYSAEPGSGLYGYSDQGYLTAWSPASGDGTGYVASLYQYIQSVNWAFPIDTPTEKGPPESMNYAYPDTEALLASQYGIGMGMQAASIGDLVTNAAQIFPLTGENWGLHFREFPYVPDHHLQTMIPGSPEQAAQFTISSITGGMSGGLLTCTGSNDDCSVFCNSPWVFISGTSIQGFNGIWETIAGNCTTGTIQLITQTGQSFPTAASSGGVVYSPAHLPLLLPFETQNCHGSFQTICSAELWEETLDWAYGTNTNSNSIGNTSSGDSAYQQAINNFLAGLPSATSVHNHTSTNHASYD
jgi:hypothetical protein